MKSQNKAIKQQSVTCKSKLESVTSLSEAYQTQIDDIETIINRLKIENKQSVYCYRQLQSKQSQIERLESENEGYETQFAACESKLNVKENDINQLKISN